MTPAIAIVGSGPSGCYLAQFLRKHFPAGEIVVFDRLPVPYGLVRYGIAPDHQGTKAVTRQFDRLFEREGVQFAGNIEVGSDVALDELRAMFDVVAMATGLQGDRLLGVPGDSLPHVYGAGRITRLVNGHPEETHEGIRLGRRAVIVGNGNVAVDILRILVKTAADFDDSDIADDTLDSLGTAQLGRIDVVGRSEAGAAKFDAAAIKELGTIEGARFRLAEPLPPLAHDDRAAASRLEALTRLHSASDKAGARVIVTFHFGWSPESIEAAGEGEHVNFAASDGSARRLKVQADSVITAVGFTERKGRDIARVEMEDSDADPAVGRLARGLYCTGWFRRGPRGTIPENRADARTVADAIAAALRAEKAPAGKPGLCALPGAVSSKLVSFDGWKAIDAFELGSAPRGRHRNKVKERSRLIELAMRSSAPHEGQG